MTSDSASRVTRSKRDLRLAVALFLGALAVVTALRAQEPPQAPAPEPVEAPAPGQDTATPAEGTAAPPEGTAPPAADAGRKPGTSPGRFEPTEKVRADFDVSFPVDI
jgi:hypothetical protein